MWGLPGAGVWGTMPDAPFVSHSETSRAAAKAIAPKAGTLRYKVLQWIRDRGEYGSTDEETQEGLAMRASTQRPRRVELMEAGYVKDSGRRRKSDATKTDAAVWVAVQGDPLVDPPLSKKKARAAYLRAGEAFAQAWREKAPNRQELAKAVLDAARAAF